MHGLQTLAWLHEQQAATAEFNLRAKANDPGRKHYRGDGAPAEQSPKAAPAWHVATVGDVFWVLPLTLEALRIAEALFPAETTRYGLHYICDTHETRNIAASLHVANED